MLVRYDYVAESHACNGQTTPSVHETVPAVHIMGYRLVDKVDRIDEKVVSFTKASELAAFRDNTFNATNYEWVSFEHDYGALQAESYEEEPLEVRVVRLTRQGDLCDTVLVTSHGGYIMSDQGKTIQKF